MTDVENKPQQSFKRRDELLAIEREVQKKWDAWKIHEQDALDDLENKNKYIVTFPYPYMNGKLHLGHAFSLTKAEFAARYQRLAGKHVLFPFGFHCTGMPIAAAAQKLQREMQEFGYPPKFPEREEEEEKEEETSGENKDIEFKDKTVHKGKKTKAKAKTGDVVYQWEIMRMQGLTDEEIKNFADPYYWLKYFPPLAKHDLSRFGCAIDWRRSFITTDINPYYDSFIRWQFNRLKELGLVVFQKRFSIFSPIDNQPCADHDRAKGEGVNPQEYTLIKCKVKQPYPQIFDSIKDKNIYLVPATLRPETMYGQTNVFVLPEGEYGAFEINDTDVFICTERSAKNMAYQGLSKEFGKTKCLLTLKGQDLIGLPLKAPNSPYDTIYTLPMLTISTSKGTGVVTSVPSDAPDDYAALMDLKNKPELRKKFGVKDEWVLPFEIVPIIDIPGYGDVAAKTLCEQLKIKSQNDKEKLVKAKEIVYNKGFYEGKMIVGPYKGTKVEIVKEKIKQEMIKNGDAVKYAEPESEVISRSGCECVVALTDQWYLKYGEENWRKKVEKNLEFLETYSSGTKKLFQTTVGWLKEWACSREFGLGTRLPWDEHFVIESLSDSTIYMAYYTVCHLLHGCVLDGSKPGPANIKPEQLTKEVWDYIFINGPLPKNTDIPEATLKKLRQEFEYWYPVDLRVSGKDLIQNHLTMYLYNHTAIFEDESKWPRSIYANGHIMVDGEKMSKSKGNFLMLEGTIDTYTSDATRIALADAGDTLDDANFEQSTANSSILKLYTYIGWVKEMIEMKKLKKLRTGPKDKLFADKVFDNAINHTINISKEKYEKMAFREALNASWFEFQKIKDQYIVDVGAEGLHEDLIFRFINVQAIIMAPITPHISEHIWSLLGNKDSIFKEKWPVAGPVDKKIARTNEYYKAVLSGIRQRIVKEQKRNPNFKPKGMYIYTVGKYEEWQLNTLKILREIYEKQKEIPLDVGKQLKDKVDKKQMKNVMTFVGQLREEIKKYGADALSDELPVPEKQILEANKDFIKESLGLEELQIFSTTDKDIIDPGKKAKQAAVTKPQFHFYV